MLAVGVFGDPLRVEPLVSQVSTKLRGLGVEVR
jgi:hypothetical protein